MRSAPLTRLLLAAALLAAAGGVRAASGGPDALGTTWFDDQEGCPVEPPVFGAGAMSFPDPVAAVGPLALGFTMPHAGGVATEVFVSPTGFVAFSDQMGAGASAVTQALPDAAAPNHLLAPFWRPIPVIRITTEAQADRFLIQWTWSGGGPLGEESVWLNLHRDGRQEVLWGTSRFSNADATVGYEDAAGAAGSTYFRNGAGLEPDFPQPFSGRSVCFAPPVQLDCSDPVVLACDETVGVDLPAALPEQASVYGCTPLLLPGHERVLRLDVPSPRRVIVGVDLPEADLLQVPGPPACDEALCLRHADQEMDFPVAFTGSLELVIDTTTPGGGVSVETTVLCEDLPSFACEERLAGSTTAELALQADYACAPVLLDGPEAHALVDHPADGHLSVTLTGTPPGLWAILRDETGNCLAAGLGGATVFDAPAGTYVVTVDGEAGAFGDFELEAACGTRLDCAAARSAACGDSLLGDTSSLAARDRVDGYSCGGPRLDGAEEVWTLSVPTEQVAIVEFVSRQPGQEAWLLSSCDEGDCLFGQLDGGCAVLQPGSYRIVVDGPAGSEGPYELRTECRRLAGPGVDIAVVDLDTSRLPDDCRDLEVDDTVFVTFTNRGTDPNPPLLDFVVYFDANGSGDYELGLDDLFAESSLLDTGEPGELVTFPMTAAGTLPFRGAPLSAKADPAELVDDFDRSNQVFDSSRHCTAPDAELPPFEAALEWEWTGSAIAPTFTDVESVPLVVDLDRDGRPEILFGAQECCGGPNTGTMLRAVSGADGSELWTADDPAARLSIACAPAAGDLDGDGLPEIVGQSLDDPSRLIALDAGGNLLWTSEPMPERSAFDTWSGGAVVADLDGDGLGEAVWGANAIAADGTLFWTPEPGGTYGSADGGALSVVADLDLDGVQEVIAGPTAYRWNEATGMGEILWRTPGIGDGYAAVAELDGDSTPEVLVAEHARLHWIEGDTGALIRTVELPSGGGASCGGISGLVGGPPSVDDVDGDGRSDVMVMVGDWFAVYEADGVLKWQAPVNECSSGITSATSFDLDGDGSKEILLKDQDTIRVLRGEDGAELWTEPGTSGTAREMPVVADVDSDGEAEFVVVENRLLGGSGVGLAGVRVFGSVASRWMPARAAWNQHAYHESNVWDDLSLPKPSPVRCAPPSPLASGTFRVQRGQPREAPPAPNLTLTLVSAERTGEVDCDQQVRTCVRVGNAGSAPMLVDGSVAWYSGDPAAGGALLAVDGLLPLAPGAWLDTCRDFVLPFDEAVELHVVADDDGAGLGRIVECREDDNACVIDDSDLSGPPPTAPLDVGPALRATGHGDPDAAEIRADFEWSLDFGAPRDLGPNPDQQHYHLYRAQLLGDAPDFALAPGSEPLLSPDWVDLTPRALDSELPLVHGYRVFAADGCERESSD